MRRLIPVVPIALMILAQGQALAAGYNIYEMGGRATALGGAFTATADDPSAIFYNSAGTAFLKEGWAASFNISFVRPKINFTRAEGITPILYPGSPTGETKSTTFFPIGTYVTYKANDEWSGGIGTDLPPGG